VPPIHTVGVYAAQLSEEPPLNAAPGSSAPLGDLELAAAAVSTAGDAIARYDATEAKLDHGLEGGTVQATKHGSLLTLKHDRLLPEVSVSGTVSLVPAAYPEDGDTALASLTVKAPDMRSGSFTATWTTAGTGAEAQLVGSVGSQPVAGSTPAP
jgi:hypothetical protein